jgi:hypothetical protein
MDWMTKGDSPWVGPLLVQPASVELSTGESTGPYAGAEHVRG